MHHRALLLATASLISLMSAAVADDWLAYKVRGNVFTLKAGQWQQLFVGDIVPDGQVVRTQKGGRIQLVRGKELVELAPDTQVMINDREGQQFTTVRQWYGKIAVDAEARNVQHFAVQTPELAAVVKGTMFVVTAGGGDSSVEVHRGHVAVEDLKRNYDVLVAAGQTVETGSTTVMQVSGSGELPIVTDAAGMPVAAGGEPAPRRGKGAGSNAGFVVANSDGPGGDDAADNRGKGRGHGHSGGDGGEPKGGGKGKSKGTDDNAGLGGDGGNDGGGDHNHGGGHGGGDDDEGGGNDRGGHGGGNDDKGGGSDHGGHGGGDDKGGGGSGDGGGGGGHGKGKD